MLYTLSALSLHPRTIALEHELANHLRSRADDPDVVREVGRTLYTSLIALGQPSAASRYLNDLRGERAESLTELATHVRQGMYWDGDLDATARAAESLAAQLERLRPGAERVRAELARLGGERPQ